MTTIANSTDKPVLVNPEGQKPSVVLQHISVSTTYRKKQEVIDWRNATRAAESPIPSRTLLYSLYADVVQDGHVIAVTGKRVDAVTTAKWKYVDSEGKEVEAINKMCDSLGFIELVKEILQSRFWGYTMTVCNFYKDEEGFLQFTTEDVPKVNMRPSLGIIANDPVTNEGLYIREGVYIGEVLEAGNHKDLGLLISAALYAIYKRGGLGDLMQFIEVFGQGILDATWDGFDETARQKLAESLRDIGNGGVIIRPDGTNINLLQNTATSDGKLHLDSLRFLNEEISKALLGTTETTSSSKSSGYAQAEVHHQDDTVKNESDIDFVRRILDTRFKRILRAQGIDTKGGKFIVEITEEKLSKKDAYTIHKSMKLDLRIPIDDDFFYTMYGVPKPKDYDKQKAALEAAKADFNENIENPEEENKAPTPPSKSGKKGKNPDNEEGKSGKKPGKLAKLLDTYREYKHFF